MGVVKNFRPPNCRFGKGCGLSTRSVDNQRAAHATANIPLILKVIDRMTVETTMGPMLSAEHLQDILSPFTPMYKAK